MPLPVPTILAFSVACAPAVSPKTMAAIVTTESGGDPLAIGLNGRQPRQLHPRDGDEAVRLAATLIAQGANLDLGLGQINSRNLAPLGLSVAEAFDPCRNLAAAGQMIATDYVRVGRTPGGEQAALRTALSYYNTGSPTRGVRNGYVAKVTAAARRLVPALEPVEAPAPAASVRPPPPPPTWDVFARTPQPEAGFVFRIAPSGDAP